MMTEPPGAAAQPAANRPADLVRALVERARELRPLLADQAPGIDETGTDPATGMRMLGEAGLFHLNVPVEYGGLWCGSPFGAWTASIDAGLEIAAGDSSVGQCWLTTVLLSRDLFH